MNITLRTLPRSSGEFSVVLTRSPGDPRDPEVVGVFKSSRVALIWLMEQVAKITRQAGPKFVRAQSRTDVVEDGVSSGTVTLTLDLKDGEELVVK